MYLGLRAESSVPTLISCISASFEVDVSYRLQRQYWQIKVNISKMPEIKDA